MEKRVAYATVVRGELDFPFRLPLQEHANGTVKGTTVLTGRVIDQAQQHGYIDRLEELGLELLTVEQTGESS